MSEALAFADHHLLPRAGSDGGALLFAAEQASLFAVDADTHAIIERWREREAIDLSAAPPADRAILAELAAARVLVRTRSVPAPLPDPGSVPLATLVLEAAQACNLRCTYCYAGGGSYGGPARRMAPELAARAARHLVAASSDRRRVTLVLFGGEPLLNLPALEAAVRAGKDAAAACGKQLDIAMTTNGTRFTEAALDFIAAHDIAVSVSIDGPPDLHDANRPRAASGRGSYAEVVAGVARLIERTGRRPAARVTLAPSQWSRIPEVFDHVLGLGFVEAGIAPVSPVSADLLPTRAQEDALLAGFATLAQRFSKAAEHGRVLPFANLLDLLAKLHAGEPRRRPCGAGLGYAAMDADGAFFLCHRFVGDARFRIGDLVHGLDAGAVGTQLGALDHSHARGCTSCWARSLCAGGCYYENHLRENELGLADGGTCAFIRRWIEIGLTVYADLREHADGAVLAFLARRAQD